MAAPMVPPMSSTTDPVRLGVGELLHGYGATDTGVTLGFE